MSIYQKVQKFDIDIKYLRIYTTTIYDPFVLIIICRDTQ